MRLLTGICLGVLGLQRNELFALRLSIPAAAAEEGRLLTLLLDLFCHRLIIFIEPPLSSNITNPTSGSSGFEVSGGTLPATEP
jgi:hypothetical protein